MIFANNSESSESIGHLTQDPSIEARITIDMLLSRHFAFLGTTGVGKSTSLSLVLRKVIARRPDIRILLLDPHNEFGSAFGNIAHVIDSNTLSLPFWLFLIGRIYRGSISAGRRDLKQRLTCFAILFRWQNNASGINLRMILA